MKKEDSIQNYFVGKIPPFLLFEKEYHSLHHVVESHKNDQYYKENNPACQVSLIGIIAYFEAFCKHQFAAIINIFPELAFEFSEKRKNIKIDLSTILSLQENTFKNLGFIIAERYDFGSSSSINNNFKDLLSMTPFSKKQAAFFEKINYKRNLLVHHAGYYTLQSLNNPKVDISERQDKAFSDNVRIEPSTYQEYSDFLFEMALKITCSTIKSIKEMDIYKSLNEESLKIKAVEKLGVALYDRIS